MEKTTWIVFAVLLCVGIITVTLGLAFGITVPGTTTDDAAEKLVPVAPIVPVPIAPLVPVVPIDAAPVLPPPIVPVPIAPLVPVVPIDAAPVSPLPIVPAPISPLVPVVPIDEAPVSPPPILPVLIAPSVPVVPADALPMSSAVTLISGTQIAIGSAQTNTTDALSLDILRYMNTETFYIINASTGFALDLNAVTGELDVMRPDATATAQQWTATLQNPANKNNLELKMKNEFTQQYLGVSAAGKLTVIGTNTGWTLQPSTTAKVAARMYNNTSQTTLTGPLPTSMSSLATMSETDTAATTQIWTFVYSTSTNLFPTEPAATLVVGSAAIDVSDALLLLNVPSQDQKSFYIISTATGFALDMNATTGEITVVKANAFAATQQWRALPASMGDISFVNNGSQKALCVTAGGRLDTTATEGNGWNLQRAAKTSVSGKIYSYTSNTTLTGPSPSSTSSLVVMSPTDAASTAQTWMFIPSTSSSLFATSTPVTPLILGSI